jgi:hypothetical protein
MMRLRVLADRNGDLTADWGCNDASTPPGSFARTNAAFRVRAVLIDEGMANSVELEVFRD